MRFSVCSDYWVMSRSVCCRALRRALDTRCLLRVLTLLSKRLLIGGPPEKHTTSVTLMDLFNSQCKAQTKREPREKSHVSKCRRCSLVVAQGHRAGKEGVCYDLPDMSKPRIYTSTVSARSQQASQALAKARKQKAL